MPIRVNRPDEEPSIKIDAIALAEQLAGGKATVVYGEPEGGEAGAGASPLPEHRTCQVPRAERMQRALEHYDEISNQACHWKGLVPAAIRMWGELEDGETIAGLRKRAEDAETHKDVWRDKWENAVERAEIAERCMAELEAQLRIAEQFAQDIAHKLGIPFSPPVEKGDCEYLVALEALKERAESAERQLAELETRAVKAEARRVDAQTHREVWRDKWERAIERAESAEAKLAEVSDALKEERDSAEEKLKITLELFEKDGKRVTEAEAENARLSAALRTIRDWPFDIRGDCVAEARKLAQAALAHGERREEVRK